MPGTLSALYRLPAEFLFSDLSADYWNYIEFQWRMLEPPCFQACSLPSIKSLSCQHKVLGPRQWERFWLGAWCDGFPCV